MSVGYYLNRNENDAIESVDFSVLEPDIEPDIHRIYKGLRYTMVGRDTLIGEGVVLDEILNALGLEFIKNDSKSDYYYELWRDLSLSVTTGTQNAQEREGGSEMTPTTTPVPTPYMASKESPVDVSPQGVGGGVRPLSVGFTARDAQPECCNCGHEGNLYNQTIINPLVRSRQIVVYACLKCFDPAR